MSLNFQTEPLSPFNVVYQQGINKKQDQFFSEVLKTTIGQSPYRFFFYGGAIRGGKTAVCIMLLILLAKRYPKSRWHIIRDSFTTLEETTIPSFEKFCPENSDSVLRYSRNKSNYFVEFKNGSKIFMVSEGYQQDHEIGWMLGLETNGILLEQIEGLQQKLWSRSLERVGSWYIDPMPPGLILSTFNPTHGWVKKEFYDKHVSGELEPPFYFLEALPSDNPMVTKEQWESWERLDPISYKQFIEGRWDSFAVEKPFMYCFDPVKHVGKTIKNARDTFYLSFDFNVDPITCIVAQLGSDFIFVHQEYRLRNSNLYELCAQIKATYGGMHLVVTGDASGLARDVRSKGNVNNYTIIMQELGLSHNQVKLPTMNPPISESRTLCNSIFARHPNIQISPACQYLIEDLKYVQVKEDGSIDKTSNAFRSHLLDTWRYLCNSFKHGFIQKNY